MFQNYLLEIYQSAFAADMGGLDPMNVYVEKPSVITSLYNHLLYHKSSAVIRMWNHAVSEEVFRGALTAFLKGK